jgi:hypothetical protein
MADFAMPPHRRGLKGLPRGRLGGHSFGVHGRVVMVVIRELWAVIGGLLTDEICVKKIGFSMAKIEIVAFQRVVADAARTAFCDNEKWSNVFRFMEILARQCVLLHSWAVAWL